MALINCPECNGIVSSTAASCPHCGWVVTNDQQVQPATQNFPPKRVNKYSPESHIYDFEPQPQNPPQSDLGKASTDPAGSTATSANPKSGTFKNVMIAAGFILAALIFKKIDPDWKPDPLRPWRNTNQNGIPGVPTETEENRRARIQYEAQKMFEESRKKLEQFRQTR